jgi:hypothetical protein
MTYQEKQSVTSLVAMTTATIAYILFAQDQGYDKIASNNASELAWALIVFVIFQVAVQIVAHILLAIAEAARREIRNDPNKNSFDKLDEREKIVDGKGERYSSYLYMVAVFVGVIMVAMQSDVKSLFIAIGVGGLASGALSEVVKLILSRRGV